MQLWMVLVILLGGSLNLFQVMRDLRMTRVRALGLPVAVLLLSMQFSLGQDRGVSVAPILWADPGDIQARDLL